MLNNIADWNELNRGGIFRFERSGDVVQTAISTDTLRVRQVLYQADGEPVFVNISGERVSRLRSLRFFLDYELSWEELGDDTNDFLSVVSDLVGAAINDEPVLFCPQPIWDDDKAVVVLFEPEEEIFEIYYDKQARKLPAIPKWITPTQSGTPSIIPKRLLWFRQPLQFV